MQPRFTSYFSKSAVPIRTVVDLGADNLPLEVGDSPLLKFNAEYYDECMSCGENIFGELSITFIPTEKNVNFEKSIFELSIDKKSFQNVDPSTVDVKITLLNGSTISYVQHVNGAIIDNIIPFSQFMYQQKGLKISFIGKVDNVNVVPLIDDISQTTQVNYKKFTYHESPNRLVAFDFLTNFPFNYKISFPKVELENYYNSFCNNEGKVMIWLDVLKWNSNRDLEVESGIFWDYRNFKRDVFGNLIGDFSVENLDVSTGIEGYGKSEINAAVSKMIGATMQFKVLLNKEIQLKLALQNVNYIQNEVNSEGWKGTISRGRIESFKIPYKFTKYSNQVYLTCLSNTMGAKIHLSVNYFQNNVTICNNQEIQRAIISGSEKTMKIVPNSSNAILEKNSLYYFNIFVGCMASSECSFQMHFSDNQQNVMAFIKDNSDEANEKTVAESSETQSKSEVVIISSLLGSFLFVEGFALIVICLILAFCLCRNKFQLKQSAKKSFNNDSLLQESNYSKV